MKHPVLNGYAVILSMALAGCGGATSVPIGGTNPANDAGPTANQTETGVPPGNGNDDGSSSQIGDGAAASSDAAAGFDPGAIGGLVGASMTTDASANTGVSPQVVDGCNALCAKEASAACPNQGSAADCVIGCRLLLNNPSCAQQTSALFACEPTSAVSCDSTGKATLDGCPLQQLDSAACFLQNAMDPTLAAPCATYCAEVAAAKCPQDAGGDCQQGCQLLGGVAPGCDADWKAYVTCANGAMFTCGADGKASAPACFLQEIVYAACVLGGALPADAGADATP